MNLLGNIFHKDSHSHKQSYDFGQVSAWPAYQLFSDIIQVLGQGGFGVVSKAHDKEANKDVAIKKVPKKSIKNREAYRRLLNFMRDDMKHPNTIHLIEWFSSSSSYYLVFELASGGDLIDRINSAGGHLYEDEARQTITSILQATQYLHERNVLHRDIKLDNYLYKSKEAPASEVILIDFGQAVLLPSNDVKLLEPCGSPTYVAPEIYNYRGYSFPADMWAIGTIAFNLLSGRSLYSSANPHIIEDETKRFTDVKFNDTFWHDVSDLAKDFIRKLLTPNPVDRMTVEEALNHGWIKNVKAPQQATKKVSFTLDAHAPIARVEKGDTLRFNKGHKPDDLLDLEGSTSGEATPKQRSGSATPIPYDAKTVRERNNGDKVMLPGQLHKKLSKVVDDDS
ncbi:Pkinase-domain-containing protein [Wallemia mellicola]|nr:Pkinase-domain-containing protein [Wallemia mellicola]